MTKPHPKSYRWPTKFASLVKMILNFWTIDKVSWQHALVSYPLIFTRETKTLQDSNSIEKEKKFF
jgi:hypothetical protein